jgi:hypothetical protein
MTRTWTACWSSCPCRTTCAPPPCSGNTRFLYACSFLTIVSSIAS